MDISDFDINNLFDDTPGLMDTGSDVASGSTGIPSIGGIQADVTNVDDIVSGHGNSSDYGAGIGAGVGAFFGGPQGANEGASIGRVALPLLEKAGDSIWGSIKNLF